MSASSPCRKNKYVGIIVSFVIKFCSKGKKPKTSEDTCCGCRMMMDDVMLMIHMFLTGLSGWGKATGITP